MVVGTPVVKDDSKFAEKDLVVLEWIVYSIDFQV